MPVILNALIPIPFVAAATYVISQASLFFAPKAGLDFSALLNEFFIQTMLGLVLYQLFRRKSIYFLFHSLLIGILVIGNGVKINFFDLPILYTDFMAIPDLISILEGWRLLLLITPFLLLIALVAFTIEYRKKFTYALLTILSAIPLLTTVYADSLTDTIKSNYQLTAWDQKKNYQVLGPSGFLLMKYFEYQSLSRDIPGADKVKTLFADAPTLQPSGVFSEKRSVHFLVLESFFDGKVLTDGIDPLYPDFRRLLQAGGESRTLSPVFGGITANAEFESLCGIPSSMRHGVEFVSTVTRPLPCLPWFFQLNGYDTLAFHPNEANFWNRTEAYKHIGFQEYYPDTAFNFNDINESFLSDSAFLEQVRNNLQSKKGPLFSYALTMSGHYPYPLDEIARKSVFRDVHSEGIVNQYLNSIYYTSKAAYDHIDQLSKADPDAIIVVFGDHLPTFADSLAIYKGAGLFGQEVSQFNAEELLTYLSTPLLILDGQRGPVNIGTTSMHEIPMIISRLIGYPDTRLYGQLVSDERAIRSFRGKYLVFDKTNQSSQLCIDMAASPLCNSLEDWNERQEIIKKDILFGGQHFVKATMPQVTQKDTAVNNTLLVHSLETGKSCLDYIEDWGPKELDISKIDGEKITVWFKTNAYVPSPQITANGRKTKVAQSSFISASFDKSELSFFAQSIELEMTCALSRKKFHIGKLRI